MKRKIYFSVLCVAVLGLAALSPLAAQSNDILDSVVLDPEMLYKDGAYLVLTAAGVVPDTASPEDAVQALREKSGEWKIKDFSPGEPITLGEYSYLIMRAFSVKGGFLYALFPGGRYAARELVFKEWIIGPTSPYRTVSGEEALDILGRAMEAVEVQS